MRRLIVIMSIVWGVCLTAFLCRFNRPEVMAVDSTSPVVAPVTPVEQLAEIKIPTKIAGTGLMIEAIFTTSDGVCALLIQNAGNYPVEKAHIAVGLGSKLLKFTTGNVAPGDWLIVKEISGLTYNNEPVFYCYGTQMLDLYLNK